MCGIFGFSGKGWVRNIMTSGLQALEYRGYDSCGYAFLLGNTIKVEKRVGKGKIRELFSGIPERTDSQACIISHTRWATHGKICMDNAHPHMDCKNEIAVVHNGIIENYAHLRKILEQKGHRFISETDTEVVPHLIEEHEKHMRFHKAVMKSLNELEGSFAILVLRKDGPGIIGARKGSPLLVGFYEDNFLISSHINPIMEYTDRVMFFEDGEMFIVSNNGIRVFNLASGGEVEKNSVRIKSGFAKSDTGGFESYMQKEIFEQPEVLNRTFESFSAEIDRYDREIDFLPGRIIIVGCGSSWHAGLIGKYIMEDFLRLPVDVEYASEFRYRNPVLLPDDLVVAISQSGETADTIGAVKAVQGYARVLSICNVLNSSIVRESDYVFYTQAGPEIGVASTKAFTSQLATLYFLNLLIGLKKGVIAKSSLKKRIEEFKELSGKILEILNTMTHIEKISASLQDRQNALFLGRGIHFPVALEGALKMKEVSYIHAEGYPAAEMKHGPIALIDEHMPVVFVSGAGRFSAKVLNNMAEVKLRGGYIITVTDDSVSEMKKVSDEIIVVPHIDNEYLGPILTVVPLQMLAFFTAIKRGCDVDKPRNLAKSVTVE